MRFRSLPLLLLLVLLVGCAVGPKEPPTPVVAAGKIAVPVTRGSYCWMSGTKGVCADTAAPPDLLEAVGYQPAVVPGGATLSITFPVAPTEGPSVNLWEAGGPVTLPYGGTVVLPDAPGIYTYDVSARWKEGSASFAFQVEVK